MRNHQKHKRIFYAPGMISLVLLPLMCLYYFYENRSFDEYGAIKLGLPSEKLFEGKKSNYVLYIPRIYKEFNFNDSKVLEKNKLKEIQLSLRELKKTNDTINGLKIHFGKKSTYAVFIKVLDILYEEDMPTWGLYKNDIWVLIGNGYIKAKKENHLNCSYVNSHHFEKLRLYEIEEEKIKQEFQSSFFKQKLQILLAYLGIVFLNILTLVKFNKNRKFNQKTYI